MKIMSDLNKLNSMKSGISEKYYIKTAHKFTFC